MSDGLPTERQLAALEQRVLTRLRARAALRARVLSGAAVAAFVVGAVVLVHPSLGPVATGASSGSAAGASTAVRGGPPAAGVVRCHSAGERDSAVTTVPLPARPSAASVAAACVAALPAPSAGSVSPARLPRAVSCRDADGAWEVFPADRSRATLCTRYGLRAG